MSFDMGVASTFPQSGNVLADLRADDLESWYLLEIDAGCQILSSSSSLLHKRMHQGKSVDLSGMRGVKGRWNAKPDYM